MKKRYLIGFLLILFSVGAEAVSFSFRHYKVEDGLSENSVFCSLQDSKGFMWFGTKEGLNRFDGSNFVVFHRQPNKKNSLENSFVHALFEDKNKTIWVGTEAGIYLYDYIKNSFSYFDKKTEDNIQIRQSVSSIIQDKKGNIWIGASDGLFQYKANEDKLIRYGNRPEDRKSLLANYANTVICDSKGDVWVGTLNGGLSRYNPATNNFINYNFPSAKKGSKISVLKIIEDSQGNLIMGTVSDGLIFFDRKTGAFNRYLMDLSDELIYFFRDIFEYSPGVYLIGSEHGLIVFERYKNQYKTIKSSTVNANSLSDNAIYSISKDKEGGVWVGSYFGGVNYISPKPYLFELYSPLETKNSISGKAVSQFCEDPNGNMWIGTEDGGLNFFNTTDKSFKSYINPSIKRGLSYRNVHSLMFDGDNLWIGMFAGGLDVLNTKTGKYKHYTSTADVHSLNDDNVFSVYKDLTGTIWVGTIAGLNRYLPEIDGFERMGDPLMNTFVYDIIQDHTGLIWVGSTGRGLFCYNPQTKVWKHFEHNPADPASLPHNKVIALYQDEKKRLWIGTEGGGLSQYVYENKKFKTFNTSNGLPNNVIYAIVADRDYLWLSSNRGLSRFNPETMEIKTFTKADGLQGNQFNFKSGFKARNGKIYFGGTNGFNAFMPDELRDNKYIPPVVITNMQLFNKDVEIGAEDSPLEQNISFTDEITLNHDQTVLNFDFVALSYCAPNKNQYAYMLEGFDKEWINVGNNHRISYTNLPTGRYTLHIKGSNNDGLWNEEGTTLKIRILPPVWASIWAYLFYIIVLVTSVYYYLKHLKQKREKEELVRLEKVQAKSEIELYNAKIDFFTHIAHEIRTPISLIKAPLDALNRKNKDKGLNDYIVVMERNTNRLMSLINQLLDFRKAEKHSHTVNYRQLNIIELLRNLTDSFSYSATARNIDLQLITSEDELIVNADAECITKIVTNLLANAIKHANNKVELRLYAAEDYYEIQVYDNGEGIDHTEKEKIFQPFYQISRSKNENQGTGIGLALTKLLVDIHGGNIMVESVKNEYTLFTVHLLRHKTASPEPAEEPLFEQIIQTDIDIELQKSSPDFRSDELPALLIVEDNEDLNSFLQNYFQENFSVMSAYNGAQAVKLLENFAPDIIISDIMMPEMDGIEFCDFVKTNTLYSHIPVILLTAKTDIKYKIEGLEHGADAYLEKPFSVEHLDAQIHNLLENRQKLRDIMVSSPLAPIRNYGKNKADEAFLNEISNIIDKHITNVDFSVDDLAQEIAMSRSNLYRKVKGLSGLTPNDFIRLVRLKKAVKLMQDGETRINEICYMVGFNTSSYFAKCFKHQFGILPKDFVKGKITLE